MTTGDPTHEMSGRPTEREVEQCVGTCVRDLEKARRTGAVVLHLYAAWYGRWLLSKAHPRPSPLGLRVSCWASAPSSCRSFSTLELLQPQPVVVDVVANFAIGHLSEAVRCRCRDAIGGRSHKMLSSFSMHSCRRSPWPGRCRGGSGQRLSRRAAQL